MKASKHKKQYSLEKNTKDRIDIDKLTEPYECCKL